MREGVLLMQDDFEQYLATPDQLKEYYSSSKTGPKKEDSLLQRAASVADRFNKGVEATGLPAAAGGFYQGVGDIGASLGNIVARPLGHPIPHPNFKKFFDNSLASSVGFGVGQVGGQIPAYLSGAGLLAKLGIGAKAALSGKIAQGILSGAALGEDDKGNRGFGAAIGGAMPVVGALAKGVSNLRSKNIAKNVLEGFASSKKQVASEFKDIFTQAKNRGVQHLERIPAKIELLHRGGNKDYIQALKDFNNVPNVSNAHSAQSDLGKYIRKIGAPSNKLERDAIEEAKRLSTTLKEKMGEHFIKSGNTDLALRYNQAREAFKQEVVPYMESKAIKALQRGDLRPKNFSKKIAEDERFISKIGQYNHPQIELSDRLRRGLASPATKTATGVAAGLLLPYGLYKYIK